MKSIRNKFNVTPPTLNIKEVSPDNSGLYFILMSCFNVDMLRGEDFLEFVLDQLGELGVVRHRRMFGSWGLYLGENFFAVLSDGVLYFKTNPITAKKYTELEMKPFTYAPGKTLKNYYEVPAEILENPSELCEWARVAASIH